MPVYLDERDIAIIRSLLEDGRKSFRQISRDTGITTPTVKARLERLINVGFIKSVIPVFDFNKVDSNYASNIPVDNKKNKMVRNNQEVIYNNNKVFEREIDEIKDRIKKGIAIKVLCYFCQNSIDRKPIVLKFNKLDLFFCCTLCKNNYIQKYDLKVKSNKKKNIKSS